MCQAWPVFPAGTPEGFLGLIAAQGESAAATEEFLAQHPNIAAATAKIAAESGQPPLSWATMAFNSMNAYRLVDADYRPAPWSVRLYLRQRGCRSMHPALAT